MKREHGVRGSSAAARAGANPSMRAAVTAARARGGQPERVERLRRALLGEVASPPVAAAPGGVTAAPAIVAELVEALRLEPLGLSAGMLAVRIRRGKARVLAALHSCPRFVMTGTGRGARWRDVGPEPLGTGTEPVSRVGSGTRTHAEPSEATQAAETAGEFASVGGERGRQVEPEGGLGSASSGATASTTASGRAS